MSIYIVNTIKSSINVEVMGIALSPDLSWADGMIGAIPVFKDKESALAYANGEESLITQVVEVSE